MRIWGLFNCNQFWVKKRNLCPIMNIWRTGKSSIILGSSMILKLASIDYPPRAIAIDWLNAVNIWLWMLCQPSQTPHSYICLGFYCNPLDGHIKKLSFPLQFPATFDLIFWSSSEFPVRYFSMPTCLWPILIHIVVVSMNLLRQTCYNCTDTPPTSYHKVFEPCNQTLIGMVGTQL